MNAVTRRERRENMTGTVGTLCKGRTPIAYADICGESGHAEVKGEAVFYYTPLGMLVCASVSGLEQGRGIYSLTLTDSLGHERGAENCIIPPLYARSGYAWCSALTEKLSPNELLGCKIAMRAESRANAREEIASGVVRRA